MSRSIEVQGVTVDEAIQQALNDLGVGRDNVEIKILHHPRSGFLGIGARRAKVRATLREQVMKDGEEFDMSPAERQSRGRRRRRPRRSAGEEERGAQSASKQGDSRGQGRKQDSQKQRDGKGGQGRRGEGRSRRDSRDSSGAGDPSQTSGRDGREAGAKQESAEGRSEDGQQKKRERGRDGQRGRGGRGRRDRGPKEAGGRNAGAKSEATATAAEPPKTEPPSQRQPEQQKTPQRDSAPAEALDSEVVLSRARELVDELARRMGFEAEIGGHLDTEAEEAVVEVKADAEGLLIGRRGQTLDALEHVVNRMVVGHNQTADVRVAIDVGGYRERRRESLVELAERLRERAVAEGRRVQVSPMSARDRRIFQQALAEDGTVETRVLGSGFYRRLLVVPVGADTESSAPDAVADFEPDDGRADTGVAEAEKPAETEPSESDRNGDATG